MSREMIDVRLLSIGISATEFLARLGLPVGVPTIEDLEGRSLADSHRVLAKALIPLWSTPSKKGEIAILLGKPADEFRLAQALECAQIVDEVATVSLLLRSEGEGADDVLEALLDLGLLFGRADALLNGQLEIAAQASRLKLKQRKAGNATVRKRVWWHEHILPLVDASKLPSRSARIDHALTIFAKEVARGKITVPNGKKAPAKNSIVQHLKRQARGR